MHKCEHEWRNGIDMFYSMRDDGDVDDVNTWMCELCFKLEFKEW